MWRTMKRKKRDFLLDTDEGGQKSAKNDKIGAKNVKAFQKHLRETVGCTREVLG